MFWHGLFLIIFSAWCSFAATADDSCPRRTILNNCMSTLGKPGYACDGQDCATGIVGPNGMCNAAVEGADDVCSSPDHRVHGLISSCTHISTTAVQGYEIIFVFANIPWYTAVDYCSSLSSDATLLPLHHSLVIDDVVAEYTKIREGLVNFKLPDNRHVVSDHLGLTCTKEEPVTTELLEYLPNTLWLDVFYNYSSKTWMNFNSYELPTQWRDAINLDEELPSKESRIILDITRKNKRKKGLYSIGTTDIDLKGNPSQASTAGVACVRRLEPNQNLNSVSANPDICTFGFKCPDTDSHCLKDFNYAATTLCNSKADCPGGQDELLAYCPHYNFTIGFTDYIYIAVVQPYAKARQYCANNNWTLPSVNNEDDLVFLKGVTERYFNHASRYYPLRIRNENFATTPWVIYLGLELSNSKFDDGSDLKFVREKMDGWTSEGDAKAYLVLMNDELTVFNDDEVWGRIHKDGVREDGKNPIYLNPFICQRYNTASQLYVSILLFALCYLAVYASDLK